MNKSWYQYVHSLQLLNGVQYIKTISYASPRAMCEHNQPIDAVVWYVFIRRLHNHYYI